MKRFLSIIFVALMMPLFHTTFAVAASQEWREDYFLTLTYNDEDHFSDAEFNVSWGDNLKVNVSHMEDLLFISGYLRYENERWFEGDGQVYVAFSDFENMYVTIPYSEYDTHPILLLQATWQDDDGTDYTQMNLYFLHYIGGEQYITPDAYVEYNRKHLSFDKIHQFRAGDEVKIVAWSNNVLSIQESSNTEWMTENGFMPNERGMAILSYYIDHNPKVDSDNPSEAIITIPQDFAVGSEHVLYFCAVAASENMYLDDGSHINGRTEWIKIPFTIVE